MISRIWIWAISALFTFLHHDLAQATPTKVPNPPAAMITPKVMILSMVSTLQSISRQILADAYWLWSHG